MTNYVITTGTCYSTYILYYSSSTTQSLTSPFPIQYPPHMYTLTHELIFLTVTFIRAQFVQLLTHTLSSYCLHCTATHLSFSLHSVLHRTCNESCSRFLHSEGVKTCAGCSKAVSCWRLNKKQFCITDADICSLFMFSTRTHTTMHLNAFSQLCTVNFGYN